MPEAWLKIGEIATLLGVSTKTLRHYQKLGLIEEPERTDGKYRLYTPRHLERLRQIRDLQQVGLKLHEVRFVLESEKPEQVLKQLLKLKIQEMEREIQKLQESKKRAKHLIKQENPLQTLLEEKIPDFWKVHLDALEGRIPQQALEREKALMGKMLSLPALQSPEQLEADMKFMQDHPEVQEMLLDWTSRVDQTDDPAELDHLALELAQSEWLRGLFGQPGAVQDRHGDFLTQALLPAESKEGWVLERVKHHLTRRLP
ncbi:MerR family transcriptional regulator [Deinococcus cellulosilyticus]|uniref:HTH merR-type domain-containing protein n=1 Tax=Deinococcus cellulosilyticus (strain DSM 18568 / NBRC 106333 / KACC 11606 / 5516J-15) TaxID=1223518 RepID=A0A511MX39_DEIC1|nr:MerR family transcriptional regulator [Deinococcus cellulosilyticus]GEM45130.1 hypothetical protein DC3_07650 [Deinococcus cellulosilyticus NBRC 106333 = KACC 11606]